ncbi:MAG: T9SS C-terminal target domain-containing protein [Chlorobiota bacterium]|nr:MAG: T9SS C-terminal target domain-containing protein [Chlorobiota bacterium]
METTFNLLGRRRQKQIIWDSKSIEMEIRLRLLRAKEQQLNFDGTQEVVGELTVYLTLPEEFSLEQNYPNPFNPSTIIKFTIPVTLSGVEGSFVTLKVYDVLGNEVATLVNEEKPAGSYEVEFNSHSDEGQNLPAGRQGLSSGIYFYTLQAGNFTQTKKLILMK